MWHTVLRTGVTSILLCCVSLVTAYCLLQEVKRTMFSTSWMDWLKIVDTRRPLSSISANWLLSQLLLICAFLCKIWLINTLELLCNMVTGVWQACYSIRIITTFTYPSYMLWRCLLLLSMLWKCSLPIYAGICCWSMLCRLLQLKGSVLCSTGSASLAIQPLLEALSLARRCHYSLLAAMTTVHLAFTQVSLYAVCSPCPC